MKYSGKQVFNRTRQQTGDTMVEVLASIAIIGLALAGGYALSNNSLRTGVEASRRSTALSLAQGQVEFLKNATLKPTILATYTAGGETFCINDDTGAKTSGPDCVDGSYTMAITYSDADKVFTVKPSWTANNNSTKELSLYYKLPDNFQP